MAVTSVPRPSRCTWTSASPDDADTAGRPRNAASATPMPAITTTAAAPMPTRTGQDRCFCSADSFCSAEGVVIVPPSRARCALLFPISYHGSDEYSITVCCRQPDRYPAETGRPCRALSPNAILIPVTRRHILRNVSLFVGAVSVTAGLAACSSTPAATLATSTAACQKGSAPRPPSASANPGPGGVRWAVE